ncbi:unnamed protein product [Sphagnum jensenii]
MLHTTFVNISEKKNWELHLKVLYDANKFNVLSTMSNFMGKSIVSCKNQLISKKHVKEIQKSLSKNYAKNIWKHRDHFLFNNYLYCTIFLVRFVKDICL